MLPQIEDGEDIRMAQRRSGPRFLLEAPQTIGVLGESERQNLDRNLSP
jgi:hypothetical protein